MSKRALLSICSLVSMVLSSGSDALAQNSWGEVGKPNPEYAKIRSLTGSSNNSSAFGGSNSTNNDTSSTGFGGSTLIPSTATHLVVSNRTGSAVTIGVQCQLPGPIVQDGCTTAISDMRIIDVTSGASPNPQQFTTYTGYNAGQGVFPLAAMHQYEIVNLKTNPYSVPANQQQNCLQGLIISFGQWNACPSTPGNAPAFPVPFVPGPNLPNGSNAAEPTLNPPNTIGGTPLGGTGSTEVCDITCVNGANSILRLTITSPSSPPAGGSQARPWQYDASGTIGAGQSFSTSNSWVNVQDRCDDNCFKIVNSVRVDRPGVFPYGCSQCNRLPDPGPPCGQFCAAQNGLPPNNGCTFNRAAQTANVSGAQFGGTVEFSYLSTAVPPPSCQNLGQP